MSAVDPQRPADPAVIRAQRDENVVVGNEIVRHNRRSRLIHWILALTFFACVFTGMPIWTPVFGWMAHLFGGLSVCRVLHRWTGVAFFLTTIATFFQWVRDARIEPQDRVWFGPRQIIQYMRYETDDSNVGKYNGGQKMLFWAVGLGSLGMLVSGLVLWFPQLFPHLLREFAFLLHDATFIALLVAIVFHIYLGTAAEPGTFRSMTRGTVTRAWARLHHPRWYRQVTGEEPRRS